MYFALGCQVCNAIYHFGGKQMGVTKYCTGTNKCMANLIGEQAVTKLN